MSHLIQNPANTGSSTNAVTLPWRQFDELLQDGLNYIAHRAKGTIKSLQTEWGQFNRIGLNGVEWNSLYVIAARPGVGKTLIGNSITRSLFKMNPKDNFLALHFQFEMLGRNMALREIAGETKLDIRYIQSAKDPKMRDLTQSDFDKMKKYVADQRGRKEYVVENAMTVEQLSKTVKQFYSMYQLPFIVTLDHTLLVKIADKEGSRQKTLENLATELTFLKRSYPVIFLILTQLNREIDDADRQQPGKLSNFPVEKDVFGSDFLLQCADVMMAFNRPAKYNLAVYGPQRFEIKPSDKFLLASHVLKNRFGDVGIQWYRADYSVMSIVENPEPTIAPKFP